MTKKEIQKRLDHYRKDIRSFQKGTEQFKYRLHLEMLLEQHLYDKEKDDRL